jgi:hypothetical protein
MHCMFIQFGEGNQSKKRFVNNNIYIVNQQEKKNNLPTGEKKTKKKFVSSEILKLLVQ